MPRERDFVPANDAGFNAWFSNLAAYVTSHASGTEKVWDHIPPQGLTELAAEYAAWYADYSPTLQPHTHGDVVKKNAARKRAERFARDFVKAYLKRPPVTDAQRADMGVHVDDQTRTEHGPPVDFVELDPEPRGPALLELRFRIRGADHHRRPPNTNGAVLYWYIGAEPPPEWDGYTQTALMTATPFSLQLKESDRGKKIFLNARWQSRGDQGPWGEPVETFVP